jgi:ATP-dependent Clp protease ATP-binding subunit ClpA
MSLKTAAADITFMKTLFTTAETAAHELGDELMGPEHLVLAALGRHDLDRTHLGALGLDAERFRAAVIEVHRSALGALGISGTVDAVAATPSGPLRSTPSAQDAFQDARTSAKAARRPLSALDILAAAARPEHGTTARALALLGVDPAALAALAAR